MTPEANVEFALGILDAYLRKQVNEGNPLFQPVVGFSLPVVVVNILAFLGLWLWWRGMKKTYNIIGWHTSERRNIRE